MYMHMTCQHAYETVTVHALFLDSQHRFIGTKGDDSGSDSVLRPLK